MRLANIRSALHANFASLFLVGFLGLAAAQNTGAFTLVLPDTTNNSQPANNPALASRLISTPGLTTANTIGNNVGLIASGPGGLAGDVRRFALPRLGTTGAAAAAGGNLWNTWAAYSRSDVGYEYSPLNSSGSVNVYLAGADYTFGGRTVFGIAVAADRSDVDLNFSSGKLKGDGVTISPYLGIGLSSQWALDATLGIGRSNVDTSAVDPIFGLVTGSTDVDRTVASLGLTFRNLYGNWQVSGRGAYLVVHDKLGAYTLSNGTFVPDGTVDVSQLRLTGQAAYGAGNFVPYFGLSYVRDLRRPNQAPINGVNAANDDDAWTPAIGLRFRSDGMAYGSFQFSSERNRAEVKNNQFLLNLGVRF